MSFPKEFLFSASSSAYQTEGACYEDGRGESMWDRIVRTRPDFIKNNDNADVTCDSYHLYRDDVRIIKEIGFDMYRFSISWTRILPTGDITDVNPAGIQHYHDVIDELLRNGIQPMVTMYHWDLPQKLQDIGGWLNPLIVDYMEDYADLLFELYGNKVKWWITINEPTLITIGYSAEFLAPALNLNSPAEFIVGHNILRAHGRIYRLYERKYRAQQNGKVSITLYSDCFKEKTNSQEDLDATKRAWTFNLDWFAHPIYSSTGDYPPSMRQLVDENSKKEGRKRSRLPTFTQEEIDSIKGSYDFFGLNHYTTYLCSPGSTSLQVTFAKDMNSALEHDPTWPASAFPLFKVVPWGLRELLKYVKDNYGNPPVFVTENGYSSIDGRLNDTERVIYFREYLSEVLNAMTNHGCNVIGYSAWSILDNFEWRYGFGSRFGLVQVDFNDPKRKRTLKASAHFFKDLINRRSIPS